MAVVKNPTPKGIVLRTSLQIGGFLFIVLILLFTLKLLSMHWSLLIVLPALVGLINYFIQHNALERFIYRKIKVIYKNISEMKSPKIDVKSKIVLSQDILSEVEAEVMDWAEVKSREIEKLQAMADYRKEFLGNVSHELKTPIFSIQGYIDTLIDGGIHDDKINVEYLMKANRNVNRMIAIVQDLENISLLESGQLELEYSNFDIRELAQEMIDNLEDKADSADMDLSLKPGNPRPVMVRADRDRVAQVMTNFLINAIRYGKRGGSAKVGIYDMNDRVLVEVSDNGIGISSENLNRVFERFFRTDKARSRERGGTGLGLSIAKHIVEAHGHSVHVRSTEDVGSTFGFTLPKA
jgi:two-component system phosphate regulon sensor histidine kinase PhoR